MSQNANNRSTARFVMVLASVILVVFSVVPGVAGASSWTLFALGIAAWFAKDLF